MYKLLAALATMTALPALAAPNLVTNGSFEQSSYTAGTEFGHDFGGQGVTGWTAGVPGSFQAYLFPATADNTTFTNRFNDGGNILATTFPGASPDGGNFIGLDGDFKGGYGGVISQTLTGLTPGAKYQVKFDWAATQLQNRYGPTTNRIDVTFGSVTKSTKTVDVGPQAFVGWLQKGFVFTADGTSDVLTFAAHGTPAGMPPFALLDGVSAAAVPEATTWALLIAGFGLVGLAARRRRMAISAA